MSLELQDMRDALKGQAKADEAIFWFCNAWHSGKQSDLYKIMVATAFFPDQHRQKQVASDPEILYCFEVLGALYTRTYGPLRESALQPVKLADVDEHDVLIAGNRFVCISTGWPCRVFKHHGALGVACAEDHNGKQFHPLTPDAQGFVVGFRR